MWHGGPCRERKEAENAHGRIVMDREDADKARTKYALAVDGEEKELERLEVLQAEKEKQYYAARNRARDLADRRAALKYASIHQTLFMTLRV